MKALKGQRREGDELEGPEEMARCSGHGCRRILKCRNWRRSAEDRDAWRRRIEEAKAQVVL
jgi:hypothetical protein